MLLNTAHSDDERGVKATARRQAQSLLVFVGHSLRGLSTASGLKESSNETFTAEILLLLLDLGSSRIQSEEGHDDVAKVARSSILDALGVMSAAEFVRGTLVVLQSSDVLVRSSASELRLCLSICAGATGSPGVILRTIAQHHSESSGGGYTYDCQDHHNNP